MLQQWLKDNYRSQHKINLVEFLQDRICKYSNQDLTPPEQVKGMMRLLKDIVDLRDRDFE